jgi:citrate lyase subunit beta/citryl-CoA lyase
MSKPRRSLLFVPGHRQPMIDKALGLECDVVLLDLEDGVPPSEKENARRLVAETLARPADVGGPERYVRVHRGGSQEMEADLRAVVRPGLAGIVLAKVDDRAEVIAATRALDHWEQDRALPRAGVRILVSIESAKGLLGAAASATADERVEGLLFGGEDFANDLGLTTEREAEASELLYARSHVAVAAAAADIIALDGIWPDIRDAKGLRREAIQARRLGYVGKSLIHPGQIAVANEVFSPTEAEVAHARRVIAAFEEAAAQGSGVSLVGGQQVDAPVVERARKLIARAEAAAG